MVHGEYFMLSLDLIVVLVVALTILFAMDSKVVFSVHQFFLCVLILIHIYLFGIIFCFLF